MSSTRSSHRRNPFDSDDKPSGPVNDQRSVASQTRVSKPLVSDAKNPLKKAQRGRDAGASKPVERSNGHGNPRNGSGNLKFGNDNPQARDELLRGADGSPFKGSYGNASARVRYDDSQFQEQDLEYKSTQELEGYAVQKSKETTSRVQNCLKVAEDIKGDATRTLLSLHEQGDQIKRTHELTLDIDQNLSRGEKLLGSLGGMFSRTWKPKKGRPVTGPAVSRNDSFKRRGNHLEQRVALGLNRSNSKGRTDRAPVNSNGQQTTQDILEMERAKQDDDLSLLSNVMDELKGMGIDMGLEISRQNVALDGLETDVTTLNDRVHGANNRARHLLGR